MRLGDVVAKEDIVPAKDKETYEPTGIRVPKSILERLQQIADTEGYSRNEIIVFMLRWALREYDKPEEKKAAKGH